jgi:CRISPR system Cascade subunit CasE
MRCFDPTFQAGQRLAFRLRANPTIKRHGKRYGLYQEAEQIEWLRRKAEEGGFILEMATPAIQQRQLRSSRRGAEMQFLAVRFDGMLRVSDPARFVETLSSGLGSAKAFGFGLLTVARPTR